MAKTDKITKIRISGTNKLAENDELVEINDQCSPELPNLWSDDDGLPPKAISEFPNVNLAGVWAIIVAEPNSRLMMLAGAR